MLTLLNFHYHILSGTFFPGLYLLFSAMPLLSCAASNFGFILSDFLHFLFHFFPELGSLHFIFWVCIPSNGHFPYNTGSV